MRIKFSGSVLLASLLVLSGLLLLIFYHKDQILDRNSVSTFYTQQYLQDKIKVLAFIKENPHQLCRLHQKEKIVFGRYSFDCQCEKLFIQKPKPREKYIQFTQIEDFLNITQYDDNVYFIHSLSELPESSAKEPKVVRVLNRIDERLTKDFYGIIITEYYFDITDKRFYGVLYSSYPNQKDKRNFVNSRQVIDRLQEKCWRWSYLSHSKRFD